MGFNCFYIRLHLKADKGSQISLTYLTNTIFKQNKKVTGQVNQMIVQNIKSKKNKFNIIIKISWNQLNENNIYNKNKRNKYKINNNY